MPTPAYPKALRFILRWEGGFVDDPADRGGRTNRGVTQRTYDSWRSRQGLAPRDVKGIEEAEVSAIYEGDYWIPPRCDILASPLDLVEFDTAVNMGPRRAVRILQTVLGCGVDGAFGGDTIAAAATCDPGNTVVEYCKVREGIYRGIVQRDPTQARFIKGWMNRLNALRAEAGIPGLEAAVKVDFGDTGSIAKVPDLGEDQQLESWR
jgi:lysozyme family protein